MGILDSILGSLMGGSSNAGPMGNILGSILGGAGGNAGGGGLSDLLNKFQQAGMGGVANSWVSNGPNQQVTPGQLGNVFGQQQVDQWSQQTGMPSHDILSELSKFLPHAVDHMTPGGQVPSGGGSPFDEAGLELPNRSA